MCIRINLFLKIGASYSIKLSKISTDLTLAFCINYWEEYTKYYSNNELGKVAS